MSGPLSTGFNLSKVSTARPLIVENHPCRCRLADIVAETKEGKGDVIAFHWQLLDPAPTTEGRSVGAGFANTQRIYLYDKETPPGQVPERSLGAISRIVDAVLGTGDEGNRKNKPARPAFGGNSAQEFVANLKLELVPKEAIVYFKVRHDETYGDSNEVSKLVFPGDLNA